MKDSAFIKTELRWAAFIAPVGTHWQHKKGGKYRVVGHSFDTERQEVNVRYYRVDGPNYDRRIDPYITFDRPVRLWTKDRFRQI